MHAKDDENIFVFKVSSGKVIGFHGHSMENYEDQ
jgi:hypothetical protein